MPENKVIKKEYWQSEFQCPNCGMDLGVDFRCYNDGCSWMPSIQDQISIKKYLKDKEKTINARSSDS